METKIFNNNYIEWLKDELEYALEYYESDEVLQIAASCAVGAILYLNGSDEIRVLKEFTGKERIKFQRNLGTFFKLLVCGNNITPLVNSENYWISEKTEDTTCTVSYHKRKPSLKRLTENITKKCYYIDDNVYKVIDVIAKKEVPGSTVVKSALYDFFPIEFPYFPKGERTLFCEYRMSKEGREKGFDTYDIAILAHAQSEIHRFHPMRVLRRVGDDVELLHDTDLKSLILVPPEKLSSDLKYF